MVVVFSAFVSEAFAAYYCTSDVSSRRRRDAIYCCSSDAAFGSEDEACGNGDTFRKMQNSCRRRRKTVCCDDKNEQKDCPTPSPTPTPTPSPTATPAPSPTPTPTPSPTATPAPSPTPTPTPSPTPATSYAASTTHYFPGDTAYTTLDQVGACGGASLTGIASKLSEIGKWYPLAIGQGMAGSMTCSTADDSIGTGCPSKTGIDDDCGGKVLHLYCGQCVEFSSNAGEVINGVVMDTCPAIPINGEWCTKDCEPNDHDMYNHLDVFSSESDSSLLFDTSGSNPEGKVKLIDCPSAVTDALTELAAASSPSPSPVCNFYKGESDNWQGCPGMSAFDCTECSGSRLYLTGANADKSEPPAQIFSGVGWAILLPLPIAAVLAFVGLWRVARRRIVGVNSQDWLVVEEADEAGEQAGQE